MPSAALARAFDALRRAGLVLMFALAILVGALAGIFLAYEKDLPQVSSLEDFEPNIITQVYASNGTLLGEFAIERRVVVGFKDIPPVLRNAVVAVEDEDFWKHLGVNPWRIPAAFIANVRSGRRSQGASTLTMQLSRTLFMTPEKTYERKIKEALLAFQIEKTFTKEEIFTFYCNQVYFGHGNYGVEAVSRFFFNKSIKDLDLAEAAMIAGLPQSPSRLSPIEHPARVIQRRNHVLQRMVEEKYVTAEEGAQAQAAPLNLHLRKDPPSVAPYFVEEVRKYLEREYGSQRIYQGGLRVHTTLDLGMQEVANREARNWLRTMDRRSRGFVPPKETVKEDGRMPERIHLDDWESALRVGDVMRGVVLASDRSLAVVRIGDYEARVDPADMAWTKRTNVGQVLPEGTVAPFRIEALSETGGRKDAKVTLEQEPEVQGSLIAIEPKSGAVQAMVGGYDFQRSKFNRATQAWRQVGSAFKPIVYAAAIEKLGYTPATIVVDSPVTYPDNQTTWSPQNFDFAFEGPITVRHAIEDSRNVPAVKILETVGIPVAIDYAKKLGLSGDLQPYLPLALGAGEATLQEMTSAYAAFANQGLRMKPHYITRITDREGNVIEEARPGARDAIRADTAYLMSSLLRGVVERGTAARARALKRPVAGKTGTTSDFADAWFIGFEPSLAAGVWIGYDDRRKTLGNHQEGSRAALPLWMNFWAEVMKDRPVEDVPIPGNIVFVPVDSSGNAAEPGTPGARMEAFIAGTEPRPGSWTAVSTSGQ